MSWHLTPIGEMARVQGGYAFKSNDWQDSGTPVVKIANVKNGYLDLAGCSYVSNEVANSATPFYLNMGDILIGMTGYVGTVAKVDSADLPAMLNQRVGRFVFNGVDCVDPAFFYRAIRLHETKSQFKSLATGSAQPNISGTQIESVRIPLPPLPTQQEIGRLLDTIDLRVSLSRLQIETLDTLGETAFRFLMAESSCGNESNG